MPADQYVYFRDGSEALLTAVTATPTIVNKTIVSEPYRDLGHRGATDTTITASEGQGLDLVVLEGATSSGHIFSPGNANIGGSSTAVKTGIAVGASNTLGLLASAPDNVTHVPPRQVDLLVPYWSFVCSDGIDKFFPVADVLGWGPNSRT